MYLRPRAFHSFNEVDGLSEVAQPDVVGWAWKARSPNEIAG